MSLEHPQNIEKSTFLGLPSEIRFLIYEYLVPDIQVVPNSRAPLRRPLRQDGLSCAPAMFATNRMIYAEFLTAWYGSKKSTYRIDSLSGGYAIGFLNYSKGEYDNGRINGTIQEIRLPTYLKHVRSLSIQIEIFTPWNWSTFPQYEAFGPSSSFVRDIWVAIASELDSDMKALQDLTITLYNYLLTEPTTNLLEEQRNVQNALEFSLMPFRRLRGLKSATLKLELGQWYTVRKCRPAAAIQELKDAARPLLDAVEAEMVMPLSGQDE